MDKIKFEELLNSQINKGKFLVTSFNINIHSPYANTDLYNTHYKRYFEKFENWNSFNLTLIKKSFINSEFSKDYDNAIIAEINKKQYHQINYKLEMLGLSISKKLQNLTQLQEQLVLLQDDEFVDNKTMDIGQNNTLKTMKRIFISHSSQDEKIVKELINILEILGLTHKEIFCTSINGYGVPLGTDFLERIKEELNSDSILISILSDNYYNSPISLCEMGAAWIKANKFIPIIIPPFQFEKIIGVFPRSIKGMKINNKFDISELKEFLEEEYTIKEIKANRWEEKRDKIISEMNKIINTK